MLGVSSVNLRHHFREEHCNIREMIWRAMIPLRRNADLERVRCVTYCFIPKAVSARREYCDRAHFDLPDAVFYVDELGHFHAWKFPHGIVDPMWVPRHGRLTDWQYFMKRKKELES